MEGEFVELYFSYDEKGVLVRIRHKNTSGTATNYYVLNNSRGDVEAIYDTDGTLVARYIYDAWGNTTVVDSNGNPITSSSHIANINPIRYRGYYYPEICRFINADDVDLLGANGDFASLNLFAYCGNNPISRADSNGFFWHIVAGAVVGGLM